MDAISHASTKYLLLTGSIWSVVSSNDYLDPASGTMVPMVSGETVLKQVFDLADESNWTGLRSP